MPPRSPALAAVQVLVQSWEQHLRTETNRTNAGFQRDLAEEESQTEAEVRPRPKSMQVCI